MFRPHRRVVMGVCHRHVLATSVAYRAYTPIFAAEPAEDKLATLRLADERRALWGPTSLIPDQTRAVEAWLRFGNDPVVHTTLPVRVAPALQPSAEGGAQTPSSSPFAYVEDYMGTNLVREDRPAHLQESIALWSQYFERKYLGRMRLSRRTAANVLGQVNAPEVLTDEADQPNTKWPQDTFFGEMSFLAERHLKHKSTTMEQLERAVWVKSLDNVEGFLNFFDAVQQQSQIRAPLPSPSVWFYEGEARRKWAEAYLPAAQAARQFVDTVLTSEVQRLGGGAQGATKLLQEVAKGFAAVHKIVVERAARQVKEGIRPAYSADSAGGAASERALRDAWCANELEREERAVHEGAYDPEDMLDGTEAWKAENKAIQDLLTQKPGGLNFSLHDFWLHMIRREALETQHVTAEDHFRAIAAAARDRMYEEGDTVATMCQSVETSLSGGSLDLRAAVFRPLVRRNPVWCKLNYAKFGGGGVVVHHSLAARRQLQYAYAASLAEVEAAATLYYDTKPLSSSLDYSSPYKLRNCLARLCANYELTIMRAAQMPFLSGARQLSEAESTMATVVTQVAAEFGVRRRARQHREQQQLQRLLVPVKSVTVCDVATELLDEGAPAAQLQAPPRGGQPPITVWPFGSRKQVHVEWPVDQLEKLRLTHQAGPLTAERAAAIAELAATARLEISLWRRRSDAEVQQVKLRAEAHAKQVDTVVKGCPAFAEVAKYARRFYEATSRETQSEAPAATATEPETEWVFACMLDDNVPLSLDQVADVYLPYDYVDPATGKRERLPQGEYVVRVRAFDRVVNPHELPALSAHAVSAPFSAFDALPQLQEQFFDKPAEGSSSTAAATTTVTHLRGEDLIPYCAFLREAGLDVPLRFEFAMGQAQDGKCMISMQHFLDELRGETFHRSCAQRGVTAVQCEIEPRYHAHWSLYHPGATAYEWAAVRRRELARAMSRERDWWLTDPLLHVPDVVTGSTGSHAAGVDYATIPALSRYAAESSAVLEADGKSLVAASSAAATTRKLSATCTVDGTGAITALSFGSGVSSAAADVSIDDVFTTALSAIQHAQTRHATLAMTRAAPFEKQAQALLFCSVHGLPFGGKYARTYAYALEKAKKELHELTAVSGKSAVGLEDAEKARVSEQEKVDRYASTTHPEQRRTRFADRVNLAGQRIEDLQPNQTTSWNR